jgi:hypothetical protein
MKLSVSAPRPSADPIDAETIPRAQQTGADFYEVSILREASRVAPDVLIAIAGV